MVPNLLQIGELASFCGSLELMTWREQVSGWEET